jgi:hypothetical protein
MMTPRQSDDCDDVVKGQGGSGNGRSGDGRGMVMTIITAVFSTENIF